MKKIVIATVLILLLGGGFLLLRSSEPESVPEQENGIVEAEPTPTKPVKPIGEEVEVEFTPNSARTKASLLIKNLHEAGVESLEYEVQYETKDLIKGINSGSEPLSVGEDGVFEDDIDFGTCSSGVCRYDKDVGKITLVIRFNTPEGTKLFKQEYN